MEQISVLGHNSIARLAEQNLSNASGELHAISYCTLPMSAASLVDMVAQFDAVQFAITKDGVPILIGYGAGGGPVSRPLG